MSDYPENFVDALRFKAAMGWADEHEALLQQMDKLVDMLCRVINIFDDNLGYEHLPDDIQDWWNKHKEWMIK